MPTRDELAENRWLAPVAHRFLSPELWRFTRRSVPRGVALGVFAAFIIPIGQVFLAVFLALPARANVPLAVLVTFVTNPFTLAFWLVVSNRIGRFFLRIDTASASTEIGREISGGSWERYSWFFQTAGTTAVGLVIMAVVGSAVGYLVAGVIWRALVGRKLKAKQQRQRLAKELEQ
ncbi:MAG: DUF2062 domain-containing protein [Sphingomonadaceae bacterium]|nr:DUF2062 domain-containing protein [Sphingomonadaceae bacterium]